MGTPFTPSTADRRRILLVDDVELNRTLTEAVLRGGAYDVDSVGDGSQALEALESNVYDLVLLDLEMPGLDGHSAAAAIRRRDPNGVRLAALSSRACAATRTRSREVGMAAHIARPIAPHELLRQIERVFCESSTDRPDPWQRQLYEEWAERLGAERMQGVLERLHDQMRTLLALSLRGEDHEALHRQAHDLASTAGMLGFLDVTGRCRAVFQPGVEDDPCRTGEALRDALESAIMRLDRHFSNDIWGAVAA